MAERSRGGAGGSKKGLDEGEQLTFELALCQQLRLPSRDELYRVITRSQYVRWGKHYRKTGFETYPTRAAIAQLTHVYLGSKMKEGTKPPSTEDLMFPQKVDERTQQQKDDELINSLFALVGH